MPGDEGESQFESEAGRRRRQRLRRRRLALLGGSAVIVAGVGAWLIVTAVTGPDSCGTGVVIYQGECVGVTDGSHAFDPSLAAVEGKIAHENRAVNGEGDFVSVALLTPLTSAPGSDVTLARIRAELEGAYTAQHNLNTQGYRPRIQLLLANEGSQQQAWPQVVRQLQTWRSADHLVAIVGVGLSTKPTLRAARALASGQNPIPMIGTVDTADGLNSAGPPASLVGSALSGPVQGLARVEPTTGDEAALLRRYLTAGPRPLRRAMLVYDTNPEDLYTATLGDDFRRQFAPYLIGSERYTGGSAVVNEFNAIASEVCPPGTVTPPAVLYAGRESLFPTFISQLRGLSMCPGRDITIVTGADAEALPASATGPNPGGPTISVVYPNLVDPALLIPGYQQAFTSLFGSADLDASWSIMTYDGVAAAQQAARAVVRESVTLLPTRAEFASALFDFNTPSHALSGAAGPFLIQPNGDEECQGLPVIVDRDGAATTVPPMRQADCP